jgi:phage-related protein
MGAEFTFYDYTDSAGANLIRLWLDGIPKKAKQQFTKWLLYLEAMPPGQWSRPQVDTLDGHCAGLFEIRVSHMRHQYRILGMHRERSPVLLHCFDKRGGEVPEGECHRAFVRAETVVANPAHHAVRHDYDDSN